MPKSKSNAPANGAAKRAENAARRRAEAARVHITPSALKFEEARHYLGGLSVPTVHRLIKRGLLRPNRATRHLLFAKSELDRFLHEGVTE